MYFLTGISINTEIQNTSELIVSDNAEAKLYELDWGPNLTLVFQRQDRATPGSISIKNVDFGSNLMPNHLEVNSLWVAEYSLEKFAQKFNENIVFPTSEFFTINQTAQQKYGCDMYQAVKVMSEVELHRLLIDPTLINSDFIAEFRQARLNTIMNGLGIDQLTADYLITMTTGGYFHEITEIVDNYINLIPRPHETQTEFISRQYNYCVDLKFPESVIALSRLSKTLDTSKRQIKASVKELKQTEPALMQQITEFRKQSQVSLNNWQAVYRFCEQRNAQNLTPDQAILHEALLYNSNHDTNGIKSQAEYWQEFTSSRLIQTVLAQYPELRIIRDAAESAKQSLAGVESLNKPTGVEINGINYDSSSEALLHLLLMFAANFYPIVINYQYPISDALTQRFARIDFRIRGLEQNDGVSFIEYHPPGLEAMHGHDMSSYEDGRRKLIEANLAQQAPHQNYNLTILKSVEEIFDFLKVNYTEAWTNLDLPPLTTGIWKRMTREAKIHYLEDLTRKFNLTEYSKYESKEIFAPTLFLEI